MTKHQIKLYRNTKDDMHCVQACLKMVFSYFKLTVPSMRELDKMTGHIMGKYTWDSGVLIYLIENGFEVMHIEPIDYGRFANEGKNYLKEIFSEEMYKDQDANSELGYEQEQAKRLIGSKVNLLNRKPTLNDITASLDDGFIPMVSSGNHIVVVTGYDENYIYVNDPGLPARESSVPLEQFKSTIYSVTLIKPSKASI